MSRSQMRRPPISWVPVSQICVNLTVPWKRERERLKLAPDLTLHSFRHTFGTLLVNRTSTPLTEAARVLGHSSVTQTERYVHKDEAQLRKGMALLDDELRSACSETGEAEPSKASAGG